MAINTIDDIAAGYAGTGAQHRNFLRNLTAPKAIGSWQSSWLATGQPAVGVASPLWTAGAGYTCSDATAGALISPYTTAAVQNWVASLAVAASQPGMIILADRLWSCSFTTLTAGTYTVTTPGALPARITDNGAGCELWMEQFAAPGTSSGTMTASYVEPGGATHSAVIPAVVSAPVIGQMQPFPLQSGDNGVKSLISATNSVTWTTNGWGITILKRFAEIPINQANVGMNMDCASLPLQKMPNNACIFAFFLANSAVAPTIQGSIDFIDK